MDAIGVEGKESESLGLRNFRRLFNLSVNRFMGASSGKTGMAREEAPYEGRTEMRRTVAPLNCFLRIDATSSLVRLILRLIDLVCLSSGANMIGLGIFMSMVDGCG